MINAKKTLTKSYYQRGQQFGFDNVKAYVRNRDNYCCQICNEDVGQEPNEVHHIIWRSQVGSSDRSDNILLLCKDCHDKVHKKGFACPTKSSSVNNYRDAGVLNTVMKYLWNYFGSSQLLSRLLNLESNLYFLFLKTKRRTI